MNKLIKILVIIFVLSLPGYAFASPVYLTIQGKISWANDNGQLLKAAGKGVGDIVKYVVMVDSDSPGTVTDINGQNDPYTHPSHANSVFSTAKGVLSGRVGQATNWFILKNGADDAFYGQTGSDSSNIVINNWNTPFEQLKAGSKIFELTEGATGKNGGWSNFGLEDITVTRVADSAPTPLPGAILLMGGGLGLVGLIRRKFVKNS